MAERVETIRLTANVSNYLVGMAAAERSTLATATAAQKLALQGAAFTNLGRSLALFGGVVAAGVVLAVKSFADFDAQMSQVKTLSHATSEEMTQLALAAETLGQKIGISATQAADAEIELVKAGVSVKDILGGALQGALQLAAAGQIDVARATEIATIALTQFNLKGADVPHVADLLAAGADKALGGVGDLGEALKSGGLIAAQFGISLDSTIGTLSAFANAGLLGETAGTDLRQMLLKLAAPSAASAAELQKLGVSIYDSSGKFVGLTDLAGQLHDKLGGVTDATRNTALATIFGARAIAGANVLYKEGAAGIAEWERKVNDSGFAAKQAAGKMDNLEGDISKLGAAFQKDLITGGSAANGVLREMVQGLTFLAQVYGDMSAPLQGSVLAIGAVVAVLTLTAGAVLTVIPKVAQLKDAMSTLNLNARNTAVGIGVAGTAIGVYLYFVGQAIAAQAKMKATGDQLRDSLDQTTGAFTAYSRELVAKELQDSGAAAQAEKYGISLTTLTAAVFGSATAFQQYLDAEKAYLDAHPGENLNVAVGDADRAIQGLQKNVKDAPGAFAALKAATEASAAGTTTAVVAYNDAAQAAQNLRDQVSKLVDEINAANGVGQDAVSTNAAYQKALADASKQVKDFVKAHGRSVAALDESTAAGSANAAMLADLARKNETAAKAQFALDGNVDTYIATLTAGHQAVVDNAIALGATADQAQAIADKVAAIPTQATVQILVDDSAAKKSLRDIAGSLAAFHGSGLNLQAFIRSVDGYARGGLTPGRASLAVVGEQGTEFVSTARTVANPDNRRALEYMHAGGVIKGYAGGGYTSPTYSIPAPASPSAGPSGGPPAVYVQNPFTGDYLLARVSDVAADAIQTADRSAAAVIANGKKEVR